jgi:uncharacterized membrane protein
MSLNLVVVVVFVVSWLIRQGDIDSPAATSGGLIAVSVGALVLLAMSGWLGGRLSYRYGVRVADESTQAEGYVDRRGGA